MSEIADELERMAKELDGRFASLQDAIAGEKDHDAKVQLGGFADGLWTAAERLRARATELRAPRHAGLPKPASVEVGQWWAEEVDEPTRTTEVYPDGHDRCASFGMPRTRMDAYTNDMLHSPDWHYFGDGERPAT